MTNKAKEILLEVKELILKEPEHYDMALWTSAGDGEDIADIEYALKNWNCDTTCCIAGYLVVLAYSKAREKKDPYYNWILDVPQMPIEIAAMDILETKELNLFYIDHWPGDLKLRVWNHETPEEMAQIGADAIDRYIYNGGSLV